MNSVTAPDGVISPMAGIPLSVNHRFPFGPTTMPSGLLASGNAVSVMVPAGVTEPMAGVNPLSVNHTSPPGPATTLSGKLPSANPVENSVITPAGVISPNAGVP